MSAGDDVFVIRRILVAVDAASTSSVVLETAALLAREFNAELDGIFVEDINLLRLAGLPFARELTWSTAMELQLDYPRMERVLRGHAAHARQAIVNVTTRFKLQASLHIARGQIAQELARAAQKVDLFILGKGRDTRGAHIGSIARQVVQQANCSVLLVAKQVHSFKAVMTVFSGNECSARALNAAAQLARALHKNLLVLIPSTTTADYQRLREQSRQALGLGPLLVTYQAAATMEACFNQRTIWDEGVGIVVMSGMVSTAEPFPAEGILESWLLKVECSVLLVR
jgi:nucleotide-binding universal stress UspA family protein